MENGRSAKSETLQKRPHRQEHDLIQTPVKENPQGKNEGIQKQQKKKNNDVPKGRESKVKMSSKVSLEKGMLCETARLRGQEKLLYVRQCQHKKQSKEQIFHNYPYCSLAEFHFDHEKLRDEKGHLQAHIIEDQKGIHLIQEYAEARPAKHLSEEREDQYELNGLGVSIFKDGRIFEGIYHDNHFCGAGYELQANGNTYLGMFKEGLKHGEGTFYWFNNDEMYKGHWLGGLPHGHGLYIAKDRYEGTFSNGLKYGFGEELFSNADRYVGQYMNSIADGYGEYYWADGSFYKGDFKHGVRHGYGIWQNQNEIYRGTYRIDKKEGFGIYLWAHKQIYKGHFKDDFREGYGEFYQIHKHQEKVIYKGCWAKGKKDEESKPSADQVEKLYAFLDESYKIESQIEKNEEKKEKKRVGHKHCIPHEVSPCKQHGRRK